jgi:hypothetical protein
MCIVIFNSVWGHPHCGSPSSVRFSSIQYSNALSPISVCNSSLRSQLQTTCNFPTRHLSKSIHSTSHAYQICQLTNGRVGCAAKCLDKKRPQFQPGIIKRRHQQEDPSRRTSQLQHQERLASCNIKKD